MNQLKNSLSDLHTLKRELAYFKALAQVYSNAYFNETDKKKKDCLKQKVHRHRLNTNKIEADILSLEQVKESILTFCELH